MQSMQELLSFAVVSLAVIPAPLKGLKRDVQSNTTVVITNQQPAFYTAKLAWKNYNCN